ncbi:MAG TPA: acylphosphatase [Acidimicrobiales bacterium]|nr:acylphosphatase [Acidimicrobiales bacterium]
MSTTAPLEVVRRHVVVTGRVQGVGFRASCARRAGDLGLVGFVRNMPDGTVEAAFEGEARAVSAMVDWCHRGPGLARVDGVVVGELPPQGETRFTFR